MKQWLQTWSERIDAMALRERVIVFSAMALVLLFLFWKLFSDPLSERQRDVARQLAQKQVDTRVLQDEVQKLLGQHDPDTKLRAQVDELRKKVAEADARLASKQSELLPPDRVPALLEEMLSRERGLQLVALKSLPAAPLFEEKTAKAAGGKAPLLQVFRHGVEITVRGNYFDMLKYLSELEQLPLRMFWRDVEISGDEYPVITMKLSVYTLSLDRTWVVV